MAILQRAVAVVAAAIAVTAATVMGVQADPDGAKMTKADDFPAFDESLATEYLAAARSAVLIAHPNKALEPLHRQADDAALRRRDAACLFRLGALRSLPHGAGHAL